MDQPPLYAFVAELARHERFQAFAAALPARARVSEPVLPLLLATLHRELGRGLLVLLPEDADARDAADGASWLAGGERVALLPSRGVRPDSGLDPPPHLVGERARALDVLAAGGLVCASAVALVEGLPPARERPAPLRLAVGAEPGVDGLARALALAGYERVERVEERGHFAVRGGIVDVFPSTGREPLRIELFGDEIEAVRAFSPFTQRALHAVADAVVYPAAERRADVAEPSLPGEEGEGAAAAHELVPPVDVDRYTPKTPMRSPEPWYLVVSRLVPHKRVDLAVDACRSVGVPLKVIGDGRALRSLRERAGPTVEFLGRLEDDAVVDHLQRCRALILPAAEDFGLTAVEAQAAGRPVIAFGQGGALESVLAGETGLFFREPTVESLVRAIEEFERRDWEPDRAIAHAARFGRDRFIREIADEVEAALAAKQRSSR